MTTVVHLDGLPLDQVDDAFGRVAAGVPEADVLAHLDDLVRAHHLEQADAAEPMRDWTQIPIDRVWRARCPDHGLLAYADTAEEARSIRRRHWNAEHSDATRLSTAT